MGIAACSRPAALHGGLGVTIAVCSAPECDVGERAKPTLLPRYSDQTAIEIMRLMLAAETTPVPRREIVVPLLGNNKILIKEKRKENRDE